MNLSLPYDGASSLVDETGETVIECATPEVARRVVALEAVARAAERYLTAEYAYTAAGEVRYASVVHDRDAARAAFRAALAALEAL
jgi:hypothetical protein